MSEGCAFCRIVTGTEPAALVHSDELVVAFLDRAPAAPGHLLVIPRVHAVRLRDLPTEAAERVAVVARRLVVALEGAPAVPGAGANLVWNDGHVAGQAVSHTHLHVVPRAPGDGLGFRFGARRIVDRGVLDETARQIRAALAHAR